MEKKAKCLKKLPIHLENKFLKNIKINQLEGKIIIKKYPKLTKPIKDKTEFGKKGRIRRKAIRRIFSKA